jgi:hypothetical protein
MNISRSIAAIIVAIILALGLIFSVLIFTHYHKWNRYGGGDDDNHRQAAISVTGIANKVFPADYIRVNGRIESNTNKETFINELLNKDISRDDIKFTNNAFTIESEFVRNVEDFINNKTNTDEVLRNQKSISVEIESFVKIDTNKYQLNFIERTYSQNGIPERESKYTMVAFLDYVPVSSNAMVRMNPLGIIIKDAEFGIVSTTQSQVQTAPVTQ